MIFVEFRNEKTGRFRTEMNCESGTLKDVKEMKEWLAEQEKVDVKHISAKFVEKGGK